MVTTLKYKIITIFAYTMFIPVFILSALMLILMSLIHLPLIYKLDVLFCRLILSTLFIWPKIKGSFPKDGTYIIMMKHSSFIDAFIFPLIPKGFYSGVTAAGNFKIPIFSGLMKRIQVVPIDRANLNSAIQSIKIAEKILKQGIHIGFLPEGTRTLTGSLGPLKKGGFHMAINTNTPIIPVGVSGAYSFKPKNRWWIKPNKITLNIGEPINNALYSDLGIEGLQALIESKLKQLSGELHENK